MNGYKGHAAIATLESLGYEYNGGEQWKPPVKAKGNAQAMAKRQREINYWAALDNEKAATQYYKGDKVFVAEPNPADSPELWEEVNNHLQPLKRRDNQRVPSRSD